MTRQLMKLQPAIWALGIFLFLITGCEETPTSSRAVVQSGMDRDNLKFHFGEPLRIEPVPEGGELWYYHFASWKGQPTGSSETADEFGQKNSSVAVGWETSRVVEEKPVHISAEGFVIRPIPQGKLVK